MSVPAILYTSLKSACERGTTSQLALDNALAKGRLSEAEHTELSAILDAFLNPPAPADEPPTDSGSTAGEDSPDGTRN